MFSGVGLRRYESWLEDIPNASACDDEDKDDLPRGKGAAEEED
jgi:hypothetical protein